MIPDTSLQLHIVSVAKYLPTSHRRNLKRETREADHHNGSLHAPEPLPLSDGVTEDYDPAIAPGQSFLIFSSKRAPTPSGSADLFIVYATANGWERACPRRAVRRAGDVEP